MGMSFKAEKMQGRKKKNHNKTGRRRDQYSIQVWREKRGEFVEKRKKKARQKVNRNGHTRKGLFKGLHRGSYTRKEEEGRDRG